MITKFQQYAKWQVRRFLNRCNKLHGKSSTCWVQVPTEFIWVECIYMHIVYMKNHRTTTKSTVIVHLIICCCRRLLISSYLLQKPTPLLLTVILSRYVCVCITKHGLVCQQSQWYKRITIFVCILFTLMRERNGTLKNCI